MTLSTPPTRKIINLSSDDSGKVSIVPTRKKQKKKKRRKTKAVENAVPNKHHGDNAPPAGTYSELLSRIEDLETAKRFMEIEIAEQESISDNLKLWLEMEQEEHNLTKEKLKIALSSSPTTNVQEEEELESPKFAKRRRKI